MLKKHTKKVPQLTAEIRVEIGLMVTINKPKDGINSPEIKKQIQDKVEEIFNIDGRDKVLNGICIYSIQ